MLIKAEQKYIRTSAKKIRFVAQSVRKVKSPLEAIAYLEMTQKRGAEPLAKVLKQAVGNARNSFGLDATDLRIKELLVNEGPSYKRGQPVSRGMFHPILKETSHVRVILESVEKQKAQSKSKLDSAEVQQKQEPKKKVTKKEGKSTDNGLPTTAKKAVVSRRKSVVKK